MGQTLENSIYLPDEGETNCYSGLASNWRALDTLKGNYSAHAINVDIHVTTAEKTLWNTVSNKADSSALTAHTGDTTIHVTSADKQTWNGHVADTTIHVTAEDKQAWNAKADASALNAHTGDATIHVTAEDKQAWNGKADNSALTAHTGDTTIHVTAEDKQAWNGKADNSALTAHTGDTTIHVTAEDKAKWDAVTSKADDSDVVHKSGNETIAGVKTFSEYITSDGSFTGDEYSNNARTNLWLMANRDTKDVSGVLFDTYRQNIAQGTGSHILGIGIKENSVRYGGCRFTWSYDNSINGYVFSLRPTMQGANKALKHELGASTEKWDTINGLNPGALSMPNLSAGVDISSYVTNLSGGTNNFTPTVDGYISLCVISTGSNGVFIRQGDFGSSGSDLTISGTRYAYACLPVVKNIQVDIAVISQSLGFAKFYPCQGNV